MSYLKQMKILYIEDDRETLKALQQCLKIRCHKVYCAESAEKALEIYELHKPDILIVDLILPGMNGSDFIRLIRRKNKTIPILITTTVSELETVTELIEHKINAYIIKPLSIEDLEAKLEAASEQVSAEAEKSNQAHFFKNLNREQAADEIRVDLLKLMKTKAGKGPAKISVLFENTQIEIIAKDALTNIEKSIASDRKNIGFAEQIRILFYKSISEDLEQIILLKTGFSFKLTDISIDVSKKTDRLHFESWG